MPDTFVKLSLALLMSARFATAQNAQGEVRGDVLDSSGAALIGARVVATDVLTNQEYATQTTTQGIYVLGQLPPGLYTIRFEADGFQTLVREGVRVTTGERLRIDAPLEIAGVVETTTVVADASLLRSEASGLGQVISHKSV